MAALRMPTAQHVEWHLQYTCRVDGYDAQPHLARNGATHYLPSGVREELATVTVTAPYAEDWRDVEETLMARVQDAIDRGQMGDHRATPDTYEQYTVKQILGASCEEVVDGVVVEEIDDRYVEI